MRFLCLLSLLFSAHLTKAMAGFDGNGESPICEAGLDGPIDHSPNSNANIANIPSFFPDSKIDVLDTSIAVKSAPLSFKSQFQQTLHCGLSPPL